jgi:putative oxidoreductase
MKAVALICRILLGLMFVVFGLNGFFHFIPMGAMPPAESAIGKWTGVMMESGWMQHVSFFQVLGGVLVLIGGTAPLGLVILGPIIANILMFHILLMGGHGIGAGAFAAVLEIILIWAYRANFAGIFTMKARPVA